MNISFHTNRFPAKKYTLVMCILLFVALAAGCGGGGSGGNAIVTFPSDTSSQVNEECGDGTVQTNEECDDSNTVTEACTYGQTSCTVCGANCTYTSGAVSYCGDAVSDLENNEFCDDGNTTSGDGCTENCELDTRVTSRLSAGSYHTCALNAAGQVRCWGIGFGYEGDIVPEFGSGNKSITAGSNYICFITAGGGVKCTQNDYWISVARGDSTYTPSYTDVTGFSEEVIQISSGEEHVCALTVSGDVKCWGNNDLGILGDGSYISTSYSAVDAVGLLDNVSAIATGVIHTCAVMKSGTVKCWGNNLFGQMGIDSMIVPTPTDVPELENIVGIAAGYMHTCALTSTGGVKCWGQNKYGQIGNGVTDDERYPPTDVTGLPSGAVEINAGKYHTCAKTVNGVVKCWGSNANSQLGTGTWEDSNTPTDANGLSSDIYEITAGESHTCVLASDGNAKCWGNAMYGKLGNIPFKTQPQDIYGIDGKVESIAVGKQFICTLSENGGVQCWGNNDDGQLGNGTDINSFNPVYVQGLSSGVSSISAGSDHVCAVMDSGTIKCWGSNNYGQLGNGSKSYSGVNVPVEVAGLGETAVSVSAGYEHTCAVTSSGAAKCWGHNSSYSLGDESYNDSLVPVDVVGFSSNTVKVSAGMHLTSAYTSDNILKRWGSDCVGGSYDYVYYRSIQTPEEISGTTGTISDLSCRDKYCCTVISGGAKCWGYNRDGEVGNGTYDISNIPTDVTGMTSGVMDVETGTTHTCAVTTAGTMKCWGDNSRGQLGISSYTRQLTPVSVVGLSNDISSISLYSSTTCAVTESGSVKCWGSNEYGQLGYDPGWTPVDIVGF